MVMNTAKIKEIIGKIKMPKLKKLSLPKIKLPKIKKVDLKPLKEKITPYAIKAYPAVKKVWDISFKFVRGFLKWVSEAIKESIAQVWTLLGFFIAWLTLTGTAQQIVGIATLGATILWLITIPLRQEKD